MSKDRDTSPPLGITPAHIWRSKMCSQRINEITGAIISYREAGKPIPDHWYIELGNVVREKVQADQTLLIDP